MFQYPINVSASGTILLGKNICCDGFYRKASIRVQTHVHDDHMGGFSTSKGFQDILMSKLTNQLLISEFDADLLIRQNIKALDYGVPTRFNNETVTLLPNDHMLGSVQVAVELKNGLKLGYSSDFNWPIDTVMKVDALVVDSTYGSPKRKRNYSQKDVDDCLIDLVNSKSKSGPVYIKAYRGTLHRALQVLSGNVNCAFLGSANLCTEVSVYLSHGFCSDPVISTNSDYGKECKKSGTRYIEFLGKGDKPPIEIESGTMILLSAYMADLSEPLLGYSNRSYRVAMTNHADFDGTLEYIKATGAKFVLTDNTRGHAVELAEEIKKRLNIAAEASVLQYSNEWGS